MSLSKPVVAGFRDVLEKVRTSVHTRPITWATVGALTYATVHLVQQNTRNSKLTHRQRAELDRYKKIRADKKKRKNYVDKEFFGKLWELLKVAVPGWTSKEALYLTIFSGFLVARTYLSIRVAEVNGSIVKAIVDLDFRKFLRRITVLALFALPSSTVNSMLKFLNAKIALSFRSRLTTHFNSLYFHPMMYYKVINIDSRISNPDQALTNTIQEWAKACATLYSDVTKPLLDIFLFSVELAQLVGIEGPGTVLAYYAISGMIIRLISPAFGKIIARAQELEGNYRHIHNRLITYSEEIAFYGGHEREKRTIRDKFNNIKQHTNFKIGKQFWSGIYDGFLTKYGSVMMGYAVLGLPVFGPNRDKYLERIQNDSSAITRDYIRNSSLLINLARAIGRVVTSYKELQHLAGYTALVSDLQTVLEDLKNGEYRREMVAPEVLDRKNYGPKKGLVEDSEEISFDDVPVVTPNGDVLVEHVSLDIKRGMNVMIVGPNGCGKSSLFRLLGGLWPVFGGRLSRPDPEDMFYIPQKPYLTVGSLRDQVIYPDTLTEYKSKGYDDSYLEELLDSVKLKFLVKREGGMDAVREWYDVLSGGEKQRVAMARVFYHKPKFAVLDECTSAVSVDVEGYMYAHCKELNIGLITVSHRPSLWKYHDYMLKFDGSGGWTFGKMGETPTNGDT